MSQRVPPRVNASVSQSVLTGSHTIITRVFAYGKSQVRVSSTGYSTSTRQVTFVSKGSYIRLVIQVQSSKGQLPCIHLQSQSASQ